MLSVQARLSDTLGSNIFILTPFSRWDCALPLWRANALLRPLPGSHHNKDVWCLTFWAILLAFSDLLTPLGLQEYSEKSCPPSTVMPCLGVELNKDALKDPIQPPPFLMPSKLLILILAW